MSFKKYCAQRNLQLTAILVSLFFMVVVPAGGATYYISSFHGNDLDEGTSPEKPWKSLGPLGMRTIEAGDAILFKAGDKFLGPLVLKTSGTIEKPITIGAYDQGARPLLDGKGAKAAIFLTNPSYVTVENLEIINAEGSYGVYLEAKNAGELRNVTLQNLDIHNVFAKSAELASDDKYKYCGGINVQVRRDDTPSWFNGLTIRGCHIHHTGPCGISISSDYPLHEKRRKGKKAYPHQYVMIEDNLIEYIDRDGAIIRQCRGAVMQNNIVAHTGQVATSNGIWYWDCADSVIQYNEGYECLAPFQVDGGPFSIDYYCSDCVIQYNYSHDNEGPSCMAFGNRQTGKGTVIRGNFSYNDNTLISKEGFAAFSLISEISETVVEDNIIIAGTDTNAMIGHHNWQGLPIDAVYRNNLFVGNGRATFGKDILPAGKFSDNLFINIPNLPKELEKQADVREFLKRWAEIQQRIEKVKNRDK